MALVNSKIDCHCLVQVDGQTFEGSGASKKLSKQACARAALTKMYNISFTPLCLVPEGTTHANMDTSNGSGQELVPGKSKIDFNNCCKLSHVHKRVNWGSYPPGFQKVRFGGLLRILFAFLGVIFSVFALPSGKSPPNISTPYPGKI